METRCWDGVETVVGIERPYTDIGSICFVSTELYVQECHYHIKMLMSYPDMVYMYILLFISYLGIIMPFIEGLIPYVI